MTEQSSGMKEAFQYVRDVYRNCVRILLSADILMEERGFVRYNWNHIYDTVPVSVENAWRSNKMLNLTQADTLLAGFLFRQYYETKKKDNDIFTICAAPWRRVEPDSFRPVCCSTRFSVVSTPDDVYWIGAMPIWEKVNVVDGEVRQYDANSGMLSEQYRQKYNQIVTNESKLIGISVPLEDIKTSNDIGSILIDPLINWQTQMQ